MFLGDRIAIANYGTTAVLFFIGFLTALRILRKLEGDAWRLDLGIALVSLGISLHQTYWFTRWVLKGNNDPATQWFLDHSWSLLVVYLIIDTGAILIAYSLFRDNCFMAKSWGRVEQVSFNFGVLSWTISLMVLWLLFFLWTGV
jgi:hypothetical protein